MLVFSGKVDGTAKNVQDASINTHVVQLAESFIHDCRLLAHEFADTVDAEITKVLRHAGTNAGNGLQVISHWTNPADFSDGVRLTCGA